MGCGYSCKYCHKFTVYLMIFLISSSSQLSSFNAQGRKLITRAASEDLQKTTLKEDKTFLRAQIGSRPPRCDRRCSSCPHCEAIQVPTNPQPKAVISKIYSRSDDDHSSNYKPMSWKCKCGNLIFNP